MLENLIIEKVDEGFNSPEVNLDFNTGVLEIKGESYVENAKEFYAPVVEWIEKFINSETKPLTLNLKLDYYNTSTSRSLQDIFVLLRKYEEKGNSTTVNWFYDDNYSSEELNEEVEDFEIVSGISIKLIKYD